MIKSIRSNVFETNSSSTHSITIVSLEDFEKWKNGEMVFDFYNEELMNKEDMPIVLDEDASDDKYMTYKEWEDFDDYLETYEHNHTTKGGEKLVAFGRFGHD